MADTNGVLSRLQAALSVYDPTWDVSVGTATYKILESVAQEIATANNNSVLQTYSYDVNTKFGQELDAFCNLFGVYRQLGKRASGVVTFYTTSTQTASVNIPAGTQVAVPIGSNMGNTTPIYFATAASAAISPGSTSIDVPVVAVLPGAIGNVQALSITSIVNSVVNVTTVSNSAATTGGVDPESDAELRSRWTSTAFNNTTGTYGKYVITALQNSNVTRANAITPQDYFDENLQVQSTISGGSTGATFTLVAYSGMTNIASGTTYSGTTIVAYSGFASSATGATVASGLQTLVSGQAASLGITITSLPSGNTIAQGFNLNVSGPLPYNLMICSGNTKTGLPVASNQGVFTVSGTNYYSWIQSANSDIGVSGTLSYINPVITNVSGYLFPQGNELVGSNLNTSAAIAYANNSDYVYPSTPTVPLTINITNGSCNPSMFPGNSIELISEYCPSSSRSTTIASGNYVDIFIDGTTSQNITEQAVFNPAYTLSSGNATSFLNSANYIVASGTSAASVSSTAGDYYIPLDQQPLINFPSQLNTSSSGIADTIYVYNNATSSGVNYPIALNPYAYITFTGTMFSGSTANGTKFINVSNANTLLYPGLALASGVATASGQPYYITQVVSSGIFVNNNVTGTYNSTTNITMSGKAVAYPIYDVTDNRNSVLSTSAVIIDNNMPTGWPAAPATMSWATYSHNYNSDVVDVEGLVQQSRPFGTNTLVHGASFVPLTINANVIFNAGSNAATTETYVFNQLNSYFSNLGYGVMISFAALTSQITQVNGVNNAKITEIDVVSIDGTTLLQKTSDFMLASNQLPTLYNIVYTVKGASNF